MEKKKKRLKTLGTKGILPAKLKRARFMKKFEVNTVPLGYYAIQSFFVAGNFVLEKFEMKDSFSLGDRVSHLG